MNIQTEILDQINSRYVLLKKKNNNGFHIIDAPRKSVLMIDDPYLNIEAIIKTMIEKGVRIYNSPDELPEATEVYEKSQNLTEPESFRIFIKKLHDINGKETGSIITALPNKMINRVEKVKMEKYMEHYAFSVLYPGEGLNLYSNTESDTASLIIIKGINSLPSVETKLYNW